MCLAIALSMMMLAVIIFVRGAVGYNMDTSSYTSAWNEVYMHGGIDEFRTPVYPVVIGLCRIIGGENWGWFVVIVQAIAFYTCGVYFSRMISGIISNRRVALFTMFLYFLFYPVVNFIPVLGTEALAFSLLSLWGYYVWKFMQRPGWGYGTGVALMTLLEIMLRPSMLLLVIAICGLFGAGMFMRRYRMTVFLLLLTVLPSVVTTALYVGEVERKTNVRTISIVSIINKYCMARQYRDVFPELLTGYPEEVLELHKSWLEDGHYLDAGHLLNCPDVVTWLDHCRQLDYDISDSDMHLIPWLEIEYLIDNNVMTYRQLNDFADAVKENHPDIWYSNILHNIAYSVTFKGRLKNAANIALPFAYGLLFVMACIRYRRFSMVNFLTLMIAGGSLLTLFLYAQDDYGRLMLPASPFLILMIGQIMNCITLRPISFRLRHFFPAGE